MECLKDKCPYWSTFVRDRLGKVYPADLQYESDFYHRDFHCKKNAFQRHLYDYKHIDEPITDEKIDCHARLMPDSCVQGYENVRNNKVTLFATNNNEVYECTWVELLHKLPIKKIMLEWWYYFDNDMNDVYPEFCSRSQRQIDEFKKRVKEKYS